MSETPNNGKSTKVAVRRRVQDIYTLILDGADTGQLIQYSSDTWGVGERMARKYIARAERMMRIHTHKRMETNLEFVMTNLRKVFSEAMAAKQFGTARQCLMDIGEISGFARGPRFLKDVEDVNTPEVAEESLDDIYQLEEELKKRGEIEEAKILEIKDEESPVGKDSEKKTAKKKASKKNK